MSVYYDFALACDLESHTPQQVVDTLSYMTRIDDYEFNDPPDEDLFKGETWKYMLQGTVTGFPGKAGSRFRYVFRYQQGDEDVFQHTLSFRSYVLDDSFYEYLLLAQWLAPYSLTRGYVGFFRTEYDDHPTLLYFKAGKLYTAEVIDTPKDIETGSVW